MCAYHDCSRAMQPTSHTLPAPPSIASASGPKKNTCERPVRLIRSRALSGCSAPSRALKVKSRPSAGAAGGRSGGGRDAPAAAAAAHSRKRATTPAANAASSSVDPSDIEDVTCRFVRLGARVHVELTRGCGAGARTMGRHLRHKVARHTLEFFRLSYGLKPPYNVCDVLRSGRLATVCVCVVCVCVCRLFVRHPFSSWLVGWLVGWFVCSFGRACGHMATTHVVARHAAGAC